MKDCLFFFIDNQSVSAATYMHNYYQSQFVFKHILLITIILFIFSWEKIVVKLATYKMNISNLDTNYDELCTFACIEFTPA